MYPISTYILENRDTSKKPTIGPIIVTANKLPKNITKHFYQMPIIHGSYSIFYSNTVQYISLNKFLSKRMSLGALLFQGTPRKSNHKI